MTRKDRVVVETPCYQSLYELARLNCDAVKWDLEQAGGAWRVDVGSLANCGKLDAMIVNSPHNPTGHQFGKGEFEEIVDIARKNDAILFSDEVYRLLEYKKSCRLPAACDVYDKAVSLGVMSKAFGLAGLRIGWIATKDAKLRRRVSELKDYTTICNSAPSEFLAEIAIKNRELVVGRALRIVKKNLGLLNSFFSRHGGLFGWKAPKAGTVAFPEIKAGGSDEFCRKLLGRKGVLLAPSSEFAFGDGNFRVGFGRQDMPEALGRLEEFVDENA
ncbi:MAG: pyridoxal phosphate-dependent aminotransferase [Candidatus Micrarchaeota archaeon]|nr:pyridoxal phosphate-dependent aminotransferase [Candidatus Micrarchaeota archaeon]